MPTFPSTENTAPDSVWRDGFALKVTYGVVALMNSISPFCRDNVEADETDSNAALEMADTPVNTDTPEIDVATMLVVFSIDDVIVVVAFCP
jgi:hypothetical protein